MALFPPIIESSMPAFDKLNPTGVKIYFTLSDYNNISEIQQIHITLRYQVNNINAFNTNVSGMFNDIYTINYQNGSNIPTEIVNGITLYYILLSKNLLSTNDWLVDTLYKVQLRFSSIQINNLSGLNQIDKFSLWSTVCLIKPIYTPDFDIININNGVISTEFADFVLTYNTQNGENISSEILDLWKIDLYLGNTLLLTSNWNKISAYNYTSSSNSLTFSCSLPFQFETEISYTIKYYIKTKNGYLNYKDFSIRYVRNNNSSFSANSKIKTYVNEEEGYIKIELLTTNAATVILRRSCSKDRFLKWEDLKTIQTTSSSSNLSYTYYDFTAESGIAYRYLAQMINNSGARGVPLYDLPTQNNTATIAEWLHAFLLLEAKTGEIENIKQLKLKFDLQLSSFNINIAESKTETIGSKYPYIRRNGNMYYKSFPISGTISSNMDTNELFISKDILNNNYTSIYLNFKYNIGYYTSQYDFTYLRKFRLAVELFLYNTKPKLYKSMQEGNILIKIMDVSLIPKTLLNRLIYTFSATAVEIDSPNIENYIKYGILEKEALS